MKMYFVETNGYNEVALVDGSNKCYLLDEQCFEKPLYNKSFEDKHESTIEFLKSCDMSNFEGCESAEECAANHIGAPVYDFKEITDNCEDFEFIREI